MDYAGFCSDCCENTDNVRYGKSRLNPNCSYYVGYALKQKKNVQGLRK
jgi:hypothetical protein